MQFSQAGIGHALAKKNKNKRGSVLFILLLLLSLLASLANVPDSL